MPCDKKQQKAFDGRACPRPAPHGRAAPETGSVPSDNLVLSVRPSVRQIMPSFQDLLRGSLRFGTAGPRGRELAPPTPGSHSKKGLQAACGTAEQVGLFRRRGTLRGPASPAGVRGVAGFSEGLPVIPTG